MKTINLIYFGKFGAGPKIALDFYNEFHKDKEINSNLIISSSNSLREKIQNNFKEKNILNKLIILKIGNDLKEIILNLFKFILKFIKIILENKRNNSENTYLYLMLHPFNFITMILIKLLNNDAKIITIIHDANQHPGERGVKLKNFLTKSEIYLSNTVATLSNEVKNILEKKYENKKIIYFPHGVFDYGFVNKAKELSNNKPIKLLSLGRIVKYKGYELLIESFKFIKRIANVELTIAGEGPIYDFIKKEEAEKLKIKIINKYLSDDDIEILLNSTDIILLSYIEASQSGIMALASCKGIPVICTPVGGLSEQAKKMGGVIISKDLNPESFANSVLEIINKNELYTNLSQKMIEAQTKISWKIGVQEIKNN